MKKQNEHNENVNRETNPPLPIGGVMAMLPSDSEMEKFIKSRSQLYTSYAVKDREGKYREVVDIKSVVELLREVLSN